MTQVSEAAPVRAAPTRTSTFNAMRYPSFRWYWAGMVLSVVSQNMEFVSISWLVLSLTDSAFAVGLTGLVNAVPIIALNLVGGALADRVNRQRLLLVIQGIAAALYLVLATLVLTGLVQFWQVLVFAFLMGCTRAFDGPTRMALLPQMVPKDEIPSAVALMNIVWQLPRMVGPAIAGVLIAALGVGPVFCISGVASIGSLLLFATLRLPRTVMTTRGNFLQNIAEGLRYVQKSPVIATLIALTFFNSVFGLSYTLMEAVFARDVLHVGSEGFGMMEAAGWVGCLVGVLAAAHFARTMRKGRQALAGAVIFGCLLMAFAWSTWFGLSLVLLFFCGLFNQLYMTTINTTLQMTISDEVRGRVLGLYGLTYSLIPLGGAITGAIAEVAGVPFAVSLGGFLVAAVALLVAWKVPRVRDLA